MAPNMMDKVAKEWLIARNIIKETLAQCYQGTIYNRSDEYHERVAVGILARLAGNNPPILLTVEDE
jgi:hypothetical protein